ncbi:unnamed protein product [Leptosia nina]|uniref:Uncharacterized protein n=1 Tax=Leptosia nina TaxID=320188 RepID=A0AAV1JE67_9NEOP
MAVPGRHSCSVRAALVPLATRRGTRRCGGGESRSTAAPRSLSTAAPCRPATAVSSPSVRGRPDRSEMAQRSGGRDAVRAREWRLRGTRGDRERFATSDEF